MKQNTVLEMLMRITPPVLALTALLATVSSVGHGQRRDVDIDARSVALTAEGKTSFAAGRYDDAVNVLESALAVDPRNLSAYNLLGHVAMKQGLPGKAIRLYRESLLIEPNDVMALGAQGEALVAKGAVAKARENLARIKQLCVATCPEQVKLAAIIDKGAPVISAEAIKPKPVITDGTPSKP
jgi:tetratricopeptide (TPR) repeat protein